MYETGLKSGNWFGADDDERLFDRKAERKENSGFFYS